MSDVQDTLYSKTVELWDYVNQFFNAYTLKEQADELMMLEEELEKQNDEIKKEECEEKIAGIKWAIANESQKQRPKKENFQKIAELAKEVKRKAIIEIKKKPKNPSAELTRYREKLKNAVSLFKNKSFKGVGEFSVAMAACVVFKEY